MWDCECYTVYTIPTEQNKVYKCMNSYDFTGNKLFVSCFRTDILKMELFPAMLLE